jgi:hypothetical protein
VLAFNREDIQEIECIGTASAKLIRFRRRRRSLPPASLRRSPGRADGQPANGAAVQGLLAELSSLRCEQFIDDRDKAGLGAPSIRSS